MSLATLTSIASLVSSLAVLLSVVYLGLQIRQSARYPGVRMIWADVRDRFPEDFRRFADAFFASEPAALTKT